MKFSARRFDSGRDTLVAVCDAELLGKTFTGNGLRIFVDEKFYFSEFTDGPGASELMRSATILNVVGKNSVELAVSCGLVDGKNVIDIGGVPHAQTVRLL